MKRASKEVISGVVLLGSIIAILILMTSNGSDVWAILVLAMLAICSAAALIAFSRTGLRAEGSESELASAMLVRPSMGSLGTHNNKEQTGKEGRRDQHRDDEYYRHRPK